MPFSKNNINEHSISCTIFTLSLPLSLLWCVESLSICPVSELRPIRHWEVGKYFKSFTGDRYIPNNALQEKYPKTTVDQ